MPGRKILLPILCALTITTSPYAHAASTDTNNSKRPNFLIIVADDLGYSDLSAYGSEIQTPHIDALAHKGITFTNFHAAAACSPTRSELLSGVDNHVAGLGIMVEHRAQNQKDKPGYEGYLNDRVVSIAELMKNAGYNTYMTGKWHLGMDEAHSPLAKGFEHSFALLVGGASHLDQRGLAPPVDPAPYREDAKRVNLPPDFGYSSNFYAGRMIHYIDQNRKDGKPFFAYLAFTAPHWPLQAPDNYLDKYKGAYDAGPDAIRTARLSRMEAMGIIPKGTAPHPVIVTTPVGPDGKKSDLWYAYRAKRTPWSDLTPEARKIEARRMEIYAAMIANLDDNIGRVIDYLKSTGAYDNTVIIFMSDNGAEGMSLGSLGGEKMKEWLSHFDNSLKNMGRKNSYVWYGETWAQVSMTPFRLFKGMSSEGGIRVPAFIEYKGFAHQGETDKDLLSVLDIVPTILDMAHIAYPDGAYEGHKITALQGKTWAPMLMGKAAHVRNDTDGLGWELFNKMAYRKGKWKAVHLHKPWGTDDWQLYDLSVDPGEVNDLAKLHPEILSDLVAAYKNYAATNGVVPSSVSPQR